MPATLRNGPTTLASKPIERRLTVIRHKTLQSATMKQKTEQRPTLVDIQNKTSRIPVCGGIKKASKIASNETNVVCISNRKVAPEVVKTQAATGLSKKLKGDATTQNHQRQKTERLKPPVVDTMPAKVQNMDSKDGDDPQMCQQYVRDIYKNLLELEREESYTINKGFLEGKSEVQSWHRAVLVDWLIQVQRKFGLLQETLYICVDTLDRYLQVNSMVYQIRIEHKFFSHYTYPHSIHTHTQAVDVTKTQLQLVGVTALLIAAKYEEVYPPSIQDFAYITAHTYSTKEIRDMERKMLRQLNYRLNKPLPIHFLRRYSKVGDANTKEHNLTKYILELSFLDASMSSMLPSKRAAGAFLLAQSLLHKKTPQQLWTPTLAYYSEYTFSDLLEVKRKLQKALKDGHTSKRFLVIREKYASANFLKVSALPVLQDL